MRIGAHMSVAGGVSKAVDRAELHGCEALQIFAKNANRWQGPPLDPAEVRRFRRRVDETGIQPVVSHASYLINLGTTDPRLRAMSIAAFADELDRAHALGLLGVVLHPGTCTAGLGGRRPSARRRRDPRGVRAPPSAKDDGAAGAHGRPGPRARLALRADCDDPRRTSTAVRASASASIPATSIASGYDIVTDAGYAETFAAFERTIGFDRLRVMHANDSKKPCGSRVDRHEHIGDGCLGLEPFRRLLHDPRFAGLPMLIETEKSTSAERPNAIVLDPLDVKNLETLRRCASKSASP